MLDSMNIYNLMCHTHKCWCCWSWALVVDWVSVQQCRMCGRRQLCVCGCHICYDETYNVFYWKWPHFRFHSEFSLSLFSLSCCVEIDSSPFTMNRPHFTPTHYIECITLKWTMLKILYTCVMCCTFYNVVVGCCLFHCKFHSMFPWMR